MNTYTFDRHTKIFDRLTDDFILWNILDLKNTVSDGRLCVITVSCRKQTHRHHYNEHLHVWPTYQNFWSTHWRFYLVKYIRFKKTASDGESCGNHRVVPKTNTHVRSIVSLWSANVQEWAWRCDAGPWVLTTRLQRYELMWIGWFVRSWVRSRCCQPSVVINLSCRK